MQKSYLSYTVQNENFTKNFSAEHKSLYFALRNKIVHLMHAYNRMIDSSNTKEVQILACALDATIDQRLQLMNDFLEIIQARESKAPQKKSKPLKKAKSKLSQTPLARRKRKERASETPAEKQKRLSHRKKLLKAWRKNYLKMNG